MRSSIIKDQLVVFLAAVMIWTLISPVHLLSDQGKRGSHIIVEKKDGRFVEGDLLVVKENSLVIRTKENHPGIPLDIMDISRIEIERRNPVLKGMRTGFFIGAGLFLLFVTVLDRGHNVNVGRGLTVEYSILFGGMVAFLGGAIGGAQKRHYSIQVFGSTKREIKKILKKLKKHARYRKD